MTTATTATGIAIDKLSEMLSESTAFQVEVGATVAAGVLPYIFAPEKRYETEDEQEEQSPHSFAVITLPPGSIETNFIAGGGANWFTISGTLELQLIRQIDDFSNLSDELTKFLNFSEGVWGHLIEQAAIDGQLAIMSANRETLIQSDEKHVAGYKVQKPFHKAVYVITWGAGS